MAAALSGAIILLVFQCAAQGQDSTPRLACSDADEESCERGVIAAALLQVDRNQVKGHSEGVDVHDSRKVSKHSTKRGDKFEGDDDPVTKKELAEHTEPMQEQIDDVELRVKSLEKAVKNDGGAAEEDEEENENDEESGEEDALDKDYVKDGNNNEGEDWADKEYEKSSDDKGGRRRRRRRRRKSTDNSIDWDEVAPPPAWNGLEEIHPKAKEHGKGRGVVTGKKYDGEYEIMMDADYVIDSNPANNEPEESREPEESNEEPPERGPKGPGKTPSEGGKTSPTSSKKEPESEGKSPSDGGKTAPREGKGKKGPEQGGKSAEAEGKVAPVEGAKEKEESLVESRHRSFSKTSPRHKAADTTTRSLHNKIGHIAESLKKKARRYD